MSVVSVKARPWLMWALPLAFFTYQFVLRLWPSLLMPQIMQQFTIDATAFGFLSAIYYIGYAGAQIPMAIALDRWGPRIVVAGCAVLCGFSLWLFTHTSHWSLALLGRFLIGVGSAAGFLGTSKAISLWFPHARYTRMVGYTFTIGLLGALYGGRPVHTMIESMGWQTCATLISSVGMGLGFFVWASFRNPRQSQNVVEVPIRLRDLKSIVTSPLLLLLAISNLLMVGSLEGFADVWGVNYLMEAYHYSKSEAAGFISLIFIGMVFGGPLLAFLSERWGAYTVIMASGIGMAVLFLGILWGDNTSLVLSLLLFSIGILCCYQVTVFAAGSDLVTPQLLGVTVAFLNCINMLGGSFFHTIIGFLMDWFWTGQMDQGIRAYNADSYTYALLAIPVCAVIGALIVQGIKCKTAKALREVRAME
jgi:MFS family permease